MSWIFLALYMICMAWLPEYYAWFVLSVSLLLSVMVRSCHACVNFVPRVSFTSTLRSGSSPSPTRQRAGPAWNHPWTFSLHEIFTCVHLKFTVYGRKQTDRHTHNFRNCSHASVGLAQARPNYVSRISPSPAHCDIQSNFYDQASWRSIIIILMANIPTRKR